MSTVEEIAIQAPAIAIVEDFVDAIARPELPGMAEYLRTEFYHENGGRFNEDLCPWVTAPNGVCDAVDSGQYTQIVLQWASRMFKTKFGQNLQIRQALHDPQTLMFASADETLAKQVFRRLYRALDKNPLTKGLLPRNKKDRNALRINFGKCELIGTHAGSKSGMADESIKVGHANEIDKWPHASTSKEGDPVLRFLKRGGEFHDMLYVIESTPAEKSRSRIYRRRKQSTDCRYWVPCPKCFRFQELRFGDGRKPGGVFWEKLNEKQDPEHARLTATYVCQHCESSLDDTARWEMTSGGVWVHAGCHVDDDWAMRARDEGVERSKWMKGEPIRDGKVYGSHISYGYHPTPGWGDLAYDFLTKKVNREDFKQWLTEDWGRCWSILTEEPDWQALAGRLPRMGTREGVVPEGYGLVTIQFDRQGEDHEMGSLPYMVNAWDTERRCHIVQYGYCQTDEEAVELVKTEWPHDDEGVPIRCARLTLDAGFEPEEMEALADRIKEELAAEGIEIKVSLTKGSSTELTSLYKIDQLNEKTANPGMWLTKVDIGRSQRWVEDVLHVIESGQPKELSVYEGDEGEHDALCIQLLNDAEDEKGRWDRRNNKQPNDWRDCLRIGNVGMERHLRAMAWSHPPLRFKHPRPSSKPPAAESGRGEDRGGFVRKPKSGIRRKRR